jgi:K+-sensing histidine kinase KdpD
VGEEWVMAAAGNSVWPPHVASLILVGGATAVGIMARAHLAPADVVMLYLVVIGLAAARLGRWPAVTASTVSVLAYDFFLVPPLYTLKVEDERHLLTFAMMFVVGISISHLTLRIRREAQQAKAAAIRAETEEMRSSLLSAVSHDLRTPLAAITGAATTLRDQDANLDRAQRADLADAICVEAERLDRLVRNLLDMTRLESGAVQVKREWVPLDEIVGSALARLDSHLAGRKIQADIPDDLPLVSVDPVLVEQVFINLLENVSRHTPGGSSVEIGARCNGDAVQIEVADRGPGIPRGFEQRIFEKFFRGTTSDLNGAGLGLAVCRAIATAHGGTLEAANRTAGGAVFRLELPLVGTPPSLPSDLERASTNGSFA